MFYSTPENYINSLAKKNKKFTTTKHDFFPYYYYIHEFWFSILLL